VPLSAGAGADIAARIIAQRMNEHWKQPVIVENRPGAGGQIGTAAVVKAEADGYTLMVQSSSHAANSAIYKSLPYDPLTDLVDVAMIGKTPYVMVSAASGPYKTLKSLIDAAKAKPGELAFASAGNGDFDASCLRVPSRPRRRAHDPPAVQGLAGSAAGRPRRARRRSTWRRSTWR
jgi:tripartite-type tricarboxylate transporter receptor subunit TctC